MSYMRHLSGRWLAGVLGFVSMAILAVTASTVSGGGQGSAQHFSTLKADHHLVPISIAEELREVRESEDSVEAVVPVEFSLKPALRNTSEVSFCNPVDPLGLIDWFGRHFNIPPPAVRSFA
jgi:hypothetical protein